MYLKFIDWVTFREEEWAGASFIGTGTNPDVNTPDYWYNSKYQGKGIRWGEPSNIKGIKRLYGLEKIKEKDLGPIEDRVPEEGKMERDKEEKEGKIRGKLNYGTEDDGEGNIGSIRGAVDPMAKNATELRKVEKMYKLTPTYELKR